MTGLLYQPFALGLRSAIGLNAGGVESYLNGKDVDAELPAWSVQVALNVALALSPELYVEELGQLASPDVASLPCQVTVTGLLYQPLAFGLRSGVGLSAGAVESYLSGKVFEPTLPALSVHVPAGAALPLSGPLYVRSALQDATPERASLPFQSIVTAALYQPFEFGPRSGVAATVGGVSSYLIGFGKVSSAEVLPA